MVWVTQCRSPALTLRLNHIDAFSQAPSARPTPAKGKAKAATKAKGKVLQQAKTLQNRFDYRLDDTPPQVKTEWALAKKGPSTLTKEELFDKIVSVDKGNYSAIFTAIRNVNTIEDKGTCLSYSGRW